jgi:Tfp pilus assembly protein PilN
MKPISINLASRPFYNTTLYVVAYSVSAALLLAMTALNLYTFTVDQASWGRLHETRAQLRSEFQALDRTEKAHRRDLERLDLAQVAVQSEFANTAILQRVFSWTLLFNRLEQVLPPEVKVRSLRPKVDKNGIHFRILGTAKTAEAFTDFEENLLQSPLFADVYPLSERSEPGRPGIEFSLACRYLPEKDLPEPPAADEEPAVPAPAAATQASGRPGAGEESPS